ncbi:START domain-containing protein 10 isoform X1 [Pongo abelii]|nr:START domain-containing protein 10 isoform X1 [Pongo abelii]XP_054381993.1 START domain-containing protein 10 isoform X1 [Pongo abelii]XP_054381994.1 START domain-containing protein 10 isoform X1 [Pongo abelii]XP_054381995.1 START domain-containing protein 10 isoform X1 [Pongo abelii]XP_054381996.1 START domain-containing protein 10 isoform X1 [Pongo abelii]XP_054381997.1 START domain-containing protein 10 isoform X1 [Pongo abelii]XP_054381999.1 START domain-containing protein 10 isoform X
MEKPAASTEPQGPRPVLGRESVQVPDDQDFRSFRSECEAEVGWNLTYSKAGVSVWVQAVEMDRTLHKIKCRMECRDVPAETLYDVLHDIEYRKKWDSNVIETFDIARLTVNADVGYYSWRCPKPLKNRDVITLRSWLPMGADYIIMNYSVKHPKYPPRKDLVRAVSIQTGYLIQSTGPKSCVITYLAQVDPKGHEEDVQGVPQVPRVEAEAPASLQAVAAPGAEPVAEPGAVGAVGAACGLTGEHRRERGGREQRGADGRRGRRGQRRRHLAHLSAAPLQGRRQDRASPGAAAAPALSPLPHPAPPGGTGPGPGGCCSLAGQSPNKRSHSLSRLITVPASHLPHGRCRGPLRLPLILLRLLIIRPLILPASPHFPLCSGEETGFITAPLLSILCSILCPYLSSCPC